MEKSRGFTTPEEPEISIKSPEWKTWIIKK
jgi:hypothetical protein